MTFIGPHPVLVCELCGRGFLVAPPQGIDQWPVWGWTATIKSEGPCAGRVVIANRETLIRNLDEWEIEHAEPRTDPD